jgi:hypothetical protein
MLYESKKYFRGEIKNFLKDCIQKYEYNIIKIIKKNMLGIPHQLHCFTMWSWWYSSFQNNANTQSVKAITCYVPYAGNEGT